jgi:hypothetical protein
VNLNVLSIITALGQMRFIDVLDDELAGLPGQDFDDLEGAPIDRWERSKNPEFTPSEVNPTSI